MTRKTRFLSFAMVTVLATLLLQPAAVGDPSAVRPSRTRPAVLVLSNDPTGNEVVVYKRTADGTLRQGRSYETGGLGGIAAGAESDPLASQGALTFDRRHSLLFAVNAGSDSVSVFEVDGRRLELTHEISSGGRFPVSVTVHESLAYVLNAGDDGNVSGFRITGRDRLRALTGGTRSLGLANTTPPDFLMSPAQVGFSPDGSHLLVTTKGNGTIEVYGVQSNGRLTEASVSTPNAGGPFAFLFDGAGGLLVTEAVTGALSSYALNDDGTLTLVDGPVPSGQMATCWIVTAKGYFYVSNTASNTLSAYAEDPTGQLTLVEPTGIAATTGAGPIDMAVTPDGTILYLQNGVDQTIQSFRVAANGTLEAIATTPGPPQVDGVPFEGIVAI